MTWRPEPMSIRDFPSCQQQLIIRTPDGDQMFEARTLGMYTSVPVVDNLELLAVMVADAALKVGTEVNQELRACDRVADTQDWELTLTVRARVKAWPAIPDLTVAKSSADQCPICGMPNQCSHHGTGGDFDLCCACSMMHGADHNLPGDDENPMTGESS